MRLKPARAWIGWPFRRYSTQKSGEHGPSTLRALALTLKPPAPGPRPQSTFKFYAVDGLDSRIGYLRLVVGTGKVRTRLIREASNESQ